MFFFPIIFLQLTFAVEKKKEEIRTHDYNVVGGVFTFAPVARSPKLIDMFRRESSLYTNKINIKKNSQLVFFHSYKL